MVARKTKILFTLFFSILFCCTMFTQAEAYSTGFDTIDQFRQDSVDVYQIITFNYTVIGGGGSHIQTITQTGQTIRDVRFHTGNPAIDQLRSQAVDQLGSEDRWEIIPEVKYIYNAPFAEITRWDLGIYDDTEYMLQRTNFSGYQEWQNVTSYVRNENATVKVTPQTFTGTKFSMVLLPAQDIANQWCNDNGAILNSVDAVNTSIVCNNKFVNYLTVSESVELELDSNLRDGYDITPVNATSLTVTAIVGLIIAISLAILAATFLISVILDRPIFDFSTHVYYSADQTINVNWTTPTLNQTELYTQYLDFCTAVSQTPSVEGYYEWSKNYFDNIQKVAPELPTLSQNNNWSTNTGAPKSNVLTSIIGFIEELIPLVIMIVIIVAFVFGGIWLFRMIRRKD